jgi:hypothetical protein
MQLWVQGRVRHPDRCPPAPPAVQRELELGHADHQSLQCPQSGCAEVQGR